jgi:hypothetical protein
MSSPTVAEMTTGASRAVVVDDRGLVVACAWCCTRAQLVALNRAYPGTVSHGCCPACATRLADVA